VQIFFNVCFPPRFVNFVQHLSLKLSTVLTICCVQSTAPVEGENHVLPFLSGSSFTYLNIDEKLFVRVVEQINAFKKMKK
jgi:hypothetical protein